MAANHGKPESEANFLALFRQILRASASIPVAFQSMYIRVKAAGHTRAIA